MNRSLLAGASLLVAFALVVVSCGDEDQTPSIPDIVDPEGTPLLPDLAPAPPVDVHTRLDADLDHWTIRFSSTLVNQGPGDFVLRGSRSTNDWEMSQEIAHSVAGAALQPIDAAMDWGGDGHDHWHISRVAAYLLVPLDDAGVPAPDATGRVDAKIGFCFFDSGRALERVGPAVAQFVHESCGEESDRQVRMGLSPGWQDEYAFVLPGQSIDIDGLADGTYRLWAEADPRGWFVETTTENNRTWVDLRLETIEGGSRVAVVIAVGPEPQ